MHLHVFFGEGGNKREWAIIENLVSILAHSHLLPPSNYIH